MLKLSHIIAKCAKNGSGPTGLRRLVNFSTSPSVVEIKQPQLEGESERNGLKEVKARNNMVAAAFASLQSDNVIGDIKTPHTDEKITKAQTVNELLSISEGSGISRRHALKVVSVLAEWSSSGKVNLADFESDHRFVKLCRILTKGGTYKTKSVASRSEDLSTILSVTADDEAAKLVASITLPQMVKVMITLSQKKRRSTLLLRALSFNITASCDKLDLKQCADLLYSMSTLNYPDDNLLTKVSSDICLGLEKDINKSAVIGSIVTSLGVLKYKCPEILDVLSDWVVKNHNICRPQDIYSLFMTLASVNYTPLNSETLFKVLIPQLEFEEAKKPTVWLDLVWSLVLLNQATNQHVNTVLNNDFVAKIEGDKSLTMSMKLKLLNINGAAQHLLKDYNGATLSANSSIHNVNIGRTKEKTEMVEAVLYSLRNLIQSDNYLKTNIMTNFGFYIDAKCILDQKCHPVSFDETDETRKANATKVAVVTYDYHDMCRSKVEPTGVNIFARKLLEAQGYKVLAVPYTEFQARDKLIRRVQYLETHLKNIVSQI